MILYGTDKARLETAAAAALEEAHRLDRLLSNYLPESDWSEVNRFAAERPVRVSTELFQLLVGLPRVQPRERRRIRYHGRAPDEGLGILQG